ncbi:unnamed protein product [Adineta ricciae]|uniref:Clusterin-associated protein 1 n=2 Tax=Adineta ricciae TaxID=249248 RepID=A0A814B4M8_ADIRI|nr:unnamed protein product [Adineta ricciae]
MRHQHQQHTPQAAPSSITAQLYSSTCPYGKATKAHVKLNTKKLYQADGYAVKEILKVITPLYKALRDSESKELDDEDDLDHRYRYAMNDDIGTLKTARSLCSTITQKGANLHELLGKEVEARESRQDVKNRETVLTDVRDGIKEAESAAKIEVAKYDKLVANVQIDEVALDEKIAKRLEEKDRHQRRLDMLKSVRPSFMNDFEKFETELNGLYADYVLKYRILSYLEKELEGHFRNQREKVQEVSRHYMQAINSQMTEQDQQRFSRQLQEHNDDIGVQSDEEDSDEDDDDEDNDDDEDEEQDDDGMNQAPTSYGKKFANGNGYGGMTGDLSDDDQEAPRGGRGRGGGHPGIDDDENVRGRQKQQRRQQRATLDDDDENF